MSKKKKEEKPVQLNMTFEEALKKALNTPLPKKEKKTKKKQFFEISLSMFYHRHIKQIDRINDRQNNPI